MLAVDTKKLKTRLMPSKEGLAVLARHNSFNSQFGTDINFPSFNYLIFGAILVLMMLFRREGLFPETRTRQVLQEAERSDAEELDGGEA